MLKKTLSLFCVVLTFFTSACHMSSKPKLPYEVDTQVLVHKVKSPVESIKEISKWYTGSVQNVKLIVVKNPFLDVQKLRVGDTVLIPLSLVKNSKPMYVVGTRPVPGKKVLKKDAGLKKADGKAEGAGHEKTDAPAVPVAVNTPVAEATTVPTPQAEVSAPTQPEETPEPQPTSFIEPTAVPAATAAEVAEPTVVPTTEVPNLAATAAAVTNGGEQESMDALIAEEQKALDLLKNELGQKQ